MTLFKKNFFYKRGWQFANKLKLFTLFFVMLTSLIAGTTSVSAQGVSTKGVNSEGWDYYPDINGGIVAKLNYQGEVACASTDGMNCLWGKLKSEIVFTNLVPLKCGSMHASIYNNDRGYGDWGHWCERLDRIKKTALLNIRPQEWVLYPNFGGIVAKLNFQGEVACASTYGQGCLHVNAKSEINFKDLKPFKCGSDHTTVYGDTGYTRVGYWCKELRAIRDGQTNPPTPPAPVDPPSQGGQNISPEGWAFYSRFGIVAKLNYQGEVACISDSGTGCRTVRKISDVNFRTRLKVFKCGPDHTTVYGYTGYNRAGYWCKELRAIRDGQTNPPTPPTPPAPVDPPSQGGQNISPEGWAFYSRFGIVAKLNYQGEVACISDSSGMACRFVRKISDVNFRTRLKVFKCGSEHGAVYNGDTGYNRAGYWCKELRAIRDGQTNPPTPPTPPAPVDPPSQGGQNISPEGWAFYSRFGIVAKLNYQGEVACISDSGTGCRTVRKISDVNFRTRLKVSKCGSDHTTVYGDTGYNRVGYWCKELRAIRDGQPGTGTGTGAKLTVKPDQLNWFAGANTIGQNILLTTNYQGEVACASTDGVSCLISATKDIDLSSLQPVKCREVDYNNPQHWCALTKKYKMTLSLQDHGYYSRPDIGGSHSAPTGEPGSVLALAELFTSIPSNSLDFEYTDLATKKVSGNISQAVSNLKFSASCSPSWVNYASSSVSEVVNKIETSQDICAQEIFKAANLQAAIVTILFKQEVVQGVTNKLIGYLNNWDGVIKNKEIYNLIVYLRSYKYVQFYNSSIVPANPALETRIANLFKQVFTQGNSFFADSKLESIRTNSLQSSVLYELIMAQGNYNSWSSDGIKYITKVVRDFNPTVFNTLGVNERVSVARVLSSIFFSLYYDTTIVGKIGSDPLFRTEYVKLVDELVKFSLNSQVASYPNMALNAAREALHHPLAYAIQRSIFYNSYRRYKSISSTNRPELYAIFTRSVKNVDVCGDFGVCDASTALIRTVFTEIYSCPVASVEFYYGTASTQAEMIQLCIDFTNTLVSFKDKLRVTNPLETMGGINGRTLEVYVYNNVNDWRLYGRGIFDLGTNSPGAFVAKYNINEAPEAHIFRTGSGLKFGKAPFWNAVHEYIHCLEAKYIRKNDDFAIGGNRVLVWFEEGLAEYFHSELYRGRDVTASSASNYYLPWLQRAKADGFVLKDIHGKFYHVYSGGYAVVKYLLEERVATFQELITRLQAGDVDGSNSIINDIIVSSFSYNQGFNAWLANEGK